MKTKQLREMSTEELLQRKQNISADFFKNRVKHSLGQLEKTHFLKRDRRTLAKIATICMEREIAEQK